MHELEGKKVRWNIIAVNGALLPYEDTVIAVREAAGLTLAQMRDTGSVANIDILTVIA